MKRSKSEPLSLGHAVLLLVLGVLLGNVFTFGVHYWNKSIPREDCTAVIPHTTSFAKRRTDKKQKAHPKSPPFGGFFFYAAVQGDLLGDFVAG